MIDVDEAHRLLFSLVAPGSVVTLPLDDALFRTLAEPIATDVDAPPFDRAQMDGYAVRAQDVAGAPVRLRVVGYAAAGIASDRSVGPGEAVKINTGAPLPVGADAVVRVEETEVSDDDTAVLIKVSVSTGKFISRRASYVAAGTVILDAGSRMTPAAIGAAATAGAARVRVYAKPRVAILSTGDELIDIDRAPAGAQIRNSNQHLLEALARASHVEPSLVPTVGDDRERLEEAIRAGLEADVLCITGGISMGDRDFVPEVLEALGVTIRIRKLAIKPGRPTIFAMGPEGTLVFALPGNPVSAFVGFELLVRPALRMLEGASGVVPELLTARLSGSLPSTRDRRSYWPARSWVGDRGQWCVERLSWGGSGDALGLARANTLIMRAPNMPEAGTGAPVMIMLLDST